MSINELTTLLHAYTGRTSLVIEYRAGYGWFILDNDQTLMGFNSKRLLKAYLAHVKERGYLYAPTKGETYGNP